MEHDDKQDLESAIQYARKYLENLLSFYGLNTSVRATADDDVIELDVPSTHMNGFLIGQRGDTMRSLQFITSNALKNQGYEYSRVNVDVAGYKKQRADRLADTAEEWVKQVRETGEPMPLRPMNAADRRVIHKLASEYDLVTESEGEGRDRHVVLKPSKTSTKTPTKASKEKAVEKSSTKQKASESEPTPQTNPNPQE